MDFNKRYNSLNEAQRKAVDTIDGPVIVLAGPGTGKTELLSVRAANILKQTDALPENILCLTFTDSGAAAIHKRLTDIIGKDAYKVTINTFHGFGSDIINQNSEYFYNNSSFQAASDINTYEILRTILDDLSHDNLLSGKHEGEYIYLKDIKKAISNIKRAGLTSDELLAILDANDESLDAIESKLTEVFDIPRMHISVADKLLEAINSVATPEVKLPPGISNILDMVIGSAKRAYEDAMSVDSSSPLTAWRNKWLEKSSSNKFVFKNRKIQEKLRALSYVYYRYVAELQSQKLYDYDDMIIQVVHALEVYDDLRFNLQEKYQYIMVDEFQDSNLAQTRIVHTLADNPVNEGRPNILVVGDDDQAIYGFQGADSSNIIDFRAKYPTAELLVLTENYRSTSNILNHARSIITQGEDRLENSIESVNKQLIANSSNQNIEVELHAHENLDGERHWLAESVKRQISDGIKPDDIVVLARKHNEIIDLLPYFQRAGIPVSYDKFDNSLELDSIIQIEKLAKLLLSLSRSQHNEVNGQLPEVISHPAWRLSPEIIWKLSTKAYDNNKRWLDTMEEFDELQPIQQWLIETASNIQRLPLEQALDLIIGNNQPDETFTSPLYDYFFSTEQLSSNPSVYLTHLEALRTIRTKLRDYQSTDNLGVESFIDFIDLHHRLDEPIQIARSFNPEDKAAVHLMTAHKSKGLEFDYVYITGAIDSTWGQKVKLGSNKLPFPANLHIEPAGNLADERLRLFYVAATRAKKQLVVSFSQTSSTGKALELASFLVGEPWEVQTIKSPKTLDFATEQAEAEWYNRLIEPTQSLKSTLSEQIDKFKLNSTALGNFIDVTRGGPQYFLLQNLLHFPQAPSPHSSFGTAIHAALQQAHNHLAASGHQKPMEDIVKDFEDELTRQHLSDADYPRFLQRGIDTLHAFIAAKQSTFSTSQRTEIRFNNQNSIYEGVHLNGAMDLVDINKAEKTIEITDYKTGKPTDRWQGRTDFEKIKLHKYRQQLMFYDLLINHSRDYSGFTVTKSELQFVESDIDGQILSIQSDYTPDQLEDFKKLIIAVWEKIKNFDLPDISEYPANYKGVLQFEQDLIDKSI